MYLAELGLGSRSWMGKLNRGRLIAPVLAIVMAVVIFAIAIPGKISGRSQKTREMEVEVEVRFHTSKGHSTPSECPCQRDRPQIHQLQL